MALPALLGGADCGPSNPLQALSKQFDRDRGISQDHFGPARAGPSTEVFRTQASPAPPGLDQDIARFFSPGQGSAVNAASGAASAFSPQQHAPNAFDLSALRSSLPLPQPQPQQQPFPSASSSAWAADFLTNQSLLGLGSNPSDNVFGVLDNAASLPIAHHTSSNLPPANQAYFPGMFRSPMQRMPIHHEPPHTELLQHHHSNVIDTVIRDSFPPEEAVIQEQSQEPPAVIDGDELARTAGRLIDTVKDETNPKFKNSAFLGLMRQLRDKEMVVEGSDMVKSSSSAVPSAGDPVGLDKQQQPMQSHTLSPNSCCTKTAAAAVGGVFGFGEGNQEIESAEREGLTGRGKRKSVHFEPPEGMVGHASVEDPEDAFWRQENEEYREYWRSEHTEQRENLHDSMAEWGKLQEDWERFETTASGIRPASVYHFQQNNPYLLGESSTRRHALHSQYSESIESVLEKEAVVQKDMQNASAWYELGVKQQENEQESKAIQALRLAVDLDPLHLSAWLALAISHTNEGDRRGAYDAIEHWVRNNKRYEGTRLLDELVGQSGEMTGRHDALIKCLIELARTTPDGEVDADIQTALGVLLNTSEEYDKAQDCFRAALAVRPNDWLLYNRVGATLANSGKAEDALWYYYRALELNPSYIRARFNLGISCINMKNYEEAASHILDALTLQEKEDNSETRGIHSSALWDCLRTTCMQLQRDDLAAVCDVRDLDGFRTAFLGMTE